MTHLTEIRLRFYTDAFVNRLIVELSDQEYILLRTLLIGCLNQTV